MSLKLKQRGFTIVELLIVIVVIGILAALVITTFTGIQRRARDTERETDIKAIHGQLEAYYAQNGRYPGRNEVNNPDWRTQYMKGLDAEALKDPRGSTQELAAAAGANVYSYVTVPNDSCGTETGEADCTGYTLTATKESGGTYTKSALN